MSTIPEPILLFLFVTFIATLFVHFLSIAITGSKIIKEELSKNKNTIDLKGNPPVEWRMIFIIAAFFLFFLFMVPLYSKNILLAGDSFLTNISSYTIGVFFGFIFNKFRTGHFIDHSSGDKLIIFSHKNFFKEIGTLLWLLILILFILAIPILIGMFFWK